MVFARLIFAIAFTVGLVALEPQRDSGSHVSGIVVDETGATLPDVEIGVLGRTSDPDGHFDFRISSDAVVFRKPGYRSRYLMTESAVNLRVVLQRLDRSLPICAGTEGRVGVQKIGFLWFAPAKGIRFGKPGRDVDYTARFYSVEKRPKKGYVMHGQGGMWTRGRPSDLDLRKTIDYEEVVYDIDGTTIVDGHGRDADGTRWRYLGKWGESASYSEATEETARLLDSFLDSVCIHRPTFR